MRLSGLLDLPSLVPGYEDLLATLKGGPSSTRIVLPDAAKPCLIAALCRDLDRNVVLVTAQSKRASQLADQLPIWLGDSTAVAHMPDPDGLFYESISADERTRQARLRTLLFLVDGDSTRPGVVVTSAHALLQRTIQPRALRESITTLRAGGRYELGALLARWVSLGYRHELLVEASGSFAHRGGIVDIYPPNLDRPLRLDFFGSDLESIRFFDPATQRSEEPLDAVGVGPAIELWPAARPAGHDELSRIDLARLRPGVRERWELELAHLRAGDSSGLDLCAPYFADATILDYLAPSTILVFDEAAQVAASAGELIAQAEALRAELVAREELLPSFPVPYASWATVARIAQGSFAQVDMTWQAPVSSTSAKGNGQKMDPPTTEFSEHWLTAKLYGGRVKDLLEDTALTLRRGAPVVVVSQQSSRLIELFGEHDLHATSVTNITSLPRDGGLIIAHGSLAEGFGFRPRPDAEPSLILLSDREVFGLSKPARVVRRKSVNREAFLTELAPGDYVVHVEHGIGRFKGLVRLSADGVEREYLSLEYSDADHLYVPTEHADRVSRYIGVGDQAPGLNRLGGAEWTRTKARVRAAAKEMANDLLDIYAARELKPGNAFGPDTVWQQELEASFPYVETPDQLQAIAEVKGDMERPKPMDRLICGDVGYGKTEIALRAAFKAVMYGKQVAMLVPTTVLAQQHYNTFRERTQAFPARVEVLSRFRSDREQRTVVAALKAGTVDICIGTHRLIQKDVIFKDLGLVIIDEEQRFGVAHKEHLKRLRKEVDVLTLTATPIPRTLYMALAGVRDISTMETPPEDRLPIKTYVTEYDDNLVREAVLRELDRGGQVFFVHNRVQTIHQAAKHLADLVPEADIAVGHGQLSEEQLEKVMLDFSAGKHDVLVCSTIIESGLDIPNVNTIVVDQAERLGLAQMYQLRGRVGRGANRAYAYFMFSKDRGLTSTAERRLRTIFEATELGAGFRIAMKDLEIRGAGNLLGSEQHGHVAAVGFDLYCRMLSEAVQELQGKAEARPADVHLDLPLAAYLPPEYVADDAIRLNLYQRLASANSEEQVSALVLEMRDRFGSLPRPAVNLAFLVQIKLLAGRAGVSELSTDGPDIVLRLANPDWLDRPALRRDFGSHLKLGHALLRIERGRGDLWMDTLQRLLESIHRSSTATPARGVPT